MKKTGNALILIALSTLLLGPAAFAQQTNQNPQGVSNPPADDTIVTSPDEPANPPAAKPSPSTPAKAAASTTTSTPVTQASATQAENPDYGIVTSVASASSAATPVTNATLEKRPYNPDEDIVGYVPSPNNELAEGTNIRTRLLDTLSTRETNAGTAFKAQVATDVYKDGRVIIPAGSELRGRVVSVSQGHHFGPSATLRLRPDVVVLPDGTAYHLYGQVVESKASNTRTDSEGGIQPASHLKKDVIEYGAGAGTGAIVGAKIAGVHGAVIGSLIGAGVITAHMLMQHPEIAEVPKGSIVTFSLTEPMDLMPTRN